jgi:hypothetical protein
MPVVGCQVDGERLGSRLCGIGGETAGNGHPTDDPDPLLLDRLQNGRQVERRFCNRIVGEGANGRKHCEKQRCDKIFAGTGFGNLRSMHLGIPTKVWCHRCRTLSQA